MKKLLVILGVIIILAGLAGAGYWYWQSKQHTSISDCKVTVPDESNPLDQGIYFTGCDFDWECEQLSEQNFRDMCLFDLARKNSDQGICNKIKSTTQKGYCDHIFEVN